MKLKFWFLFCLMIVAIASSWIAWTQERAAIESKFISINLKFAEFAQEHERAMRAASQALRLRSEINDKYQLRMLELEKALDACPLGDALIPDSLRLTFQPDPAPDNQGETPSRAP